MRDNTESLKNVKYYHLEKVCEKLPSAHVRKGCTGHLHPAARAEEESKQQERVG